MKKYLFMFLALGLMVACSNDEKEETTPDGGGNSSLITISPIITRATETDFESGDQIGLTVTCDGTAYAENACLSYADELFSGELEWYDGDASADFAAYYPYNASGTPATFTVAADQSSEGAYEASDLLLSYKSGITPSSDPVNMTFYHKMTKFLISLSNTTNSEISAVTVSGSIPTATIDYENTAVAVDETASASDIAAQQVSETVWRAIIVPQTAQLTLAVTLSDETEYEADLTGTDFVSGGQYGVSASLSEDGLEVNLDDEYGDWTDEDITIVYPKGDLEEHLDDNYIIYHDVTYKTVTFSNGTTWMAENLRYVPEGYTPSSDPATDTEAHIYYPYTFDYEQAVTDNAVKAAMDSQYIIPLTDDESILEKGYLYDLEVALGVELTDDNITTLEDVQGICPNGWHIPNRAEWFDLIGAGNKGLGESASPENYTDAVLWDSDTGYATIANAIDQFGFTFTGAVLSNKYQATMIQSSNSTFEDYYGNQAVTYYWTSTDYSSTQFHAVMTTFTTGGYPLGRLSLAYAATSTATAIRCVRDGGPDFYEKHSDFIRPADYVAE